MIVDRDVQTPCTVLDAVLHRQRLRVALPTKHQGKGLQLPTTHLLSQYLWVDTFLLTGTHQLMQHTAQHPVIYIANHFPRYVYCHTQ